MDSSFVICPQCSIEKFIEPCYLRKYKRCRDCMRTKWKANNGKYRLPGKKLSKNWGYLGR